MAAKCPKLHFTFLVSVVAAIFLSVSVARVYTQTQAAINAEARADFAKADVDLNKTYQAVLVKLSPNEKQKLREAQRAWVASRDAEAADAVRETEGSIGPTVRYGRMTEFTRKRIAELNAMIGQENSQTEPSRGEPDVYHIAVYAEAEADKAEGAELARLISDELRRDKRVVIDNHAPYLTISCGIMTHTHGERLVASVAFMLANSQVLEHFPLTADSLQSLAHQVVLELGKRELNERHQHRSQGGD